MSSTRSLLHQTCARHAIYRSAGKKTFATPPQHDETRIAAAVGCHYAIDGITHIQQGHKDSRVSRNSQSTTRSLGFSIATPSTLASRSRITDDPSIAAKRDRRGRRNERRARGRSGESGGGTHGAAPRCGGGPTPLLTRVSLLNLPERSGGRRWRLGLLVERAIGAAGAYDPVPGCFVP